MPYSSEVERGREGACGCSRGAGEAHRSITTSLTTTHPNHTQHQGVCEGPTMAHFNATKLSARDHLLVVVPGIPTVMLVCVKVGHGGVPVPEVPGLCH